MRWMQRTQRGGMASKRKPRLTDLGHISIRLGKELRGILDEVAEADNVDPASVVRRCLVSSFSLRDRFRTQVDDLVKAKGQRWLSRKRRSA